MAASSSSSVVELDMATEDNTQTSVSSADGNAGGAALSWRVAEKITSTLNEAELQALCQKYNVPDVYTPYSAGEKPACKVEDNAISVYPVAFDAGMRLPLHEFYVEVLRHYGLAPSQLTPNAWSYMAAFVLICADAGVEPSLPVFQSFMVLTTNGDFYYFRPYMNKKKPWLFCSEIPVYRPGWKSRFFFLRSPTTMPWPCPVKWGEPSRVAIRKPTLTTSERTAKQKLMDRAAAVGKERIDVVRFISKRTLPVGRHVFFTPQHHLTAVKEEATAIAGTIKQSRKCKSPESSTPPPQQSQSGVKTSTPLGSARVGTELPNVSGGKRSTAKQGLVDSMAGVFEQAKIAMAELAGKEQELQESKDEIARLKQELQLAGQERKLQAIKDEVVQLKLELQVAREDRATTEAHMKLLEKENAAHSANVAQLGEELRMAKYAHMKQLEKANEQHLADVARLSKECRMAKEAHVKQAEKANVLHSANVRQLSEKLRMAKEAHSKKLETMKAEHDAEVGRFTGELQLATAKHAAELQAVKGECQNMLLRCLERVNTELKHPLLSNDGDQLAGGVQGPDP